MEQTTIAFKDVFPDAGLESYLSSLKTGWLEYKDIRDMLNKIQDAAKQGKLDEDLKILSGAAAKADKEYEAKIMDNLQNLSI